MFPLAAHATTRKLNATEAARFASAPPVGACKHAHLPKIAAATGCKSIVGTVGTEDAWPTSATAHLVAGGHSDANRPAHARRLGEWVATQRGATPPDTEDTLR